jgi:hypothetical protein
MSLHLNDGQSPSHEISMSRELKRGHEQNSAFLPLTNCKGREALEYEGVLFPVLHQMHHRTA